MHHGGISSFISTDRIVLNRLVGAVLHERHVFVGRRVIDDLRSVVFEYAEDPAAVADGADQRHQIELRIFLAQFHLNIVGIVLVDIKDDQLFGRMRRDLPAELAADGAAAACDQHCFAVDEVEDFLHVSLDGLSAQEVFHRNLFHLADRYITAHKLVHTGQILELAVGLFADIEDISALFRGCAGDSQIDLLDPVLVDIFQDALPAAHDRNAVDEAPPLVVVVVDHAEDLILQLDRAANVADDGLAGVAGSDDHDAPFVGAHSVMNAQKDDKSIGESNANHEQELQHDADHVVRDRHAFE